MAFKMKGPSLLKMTSALKQVPGFILTPRVNVSGAFTPEGGEYKTPSSEEVKLSQARKTCRENPATEWKNGKCVKKSISQKGGTTGAGSNIA